MKAHFDQKSDALYLRLDDSKIVESEEVKPGIILDFNDENQVVGVEILGVAKRVPKASKRVKGARHHSGYPVQPKHIGDSDMAKSRTYKTSGLPGVVAPHYHVTKISEGGKSRSGAGKTAQESQRKAAKNWEKAKKR